MKTNTRSICTGSILLRFFIYKANAITKPNAPAKPAPPNMLCLPVKVFAAPVNDDTDGALVEDVDVALFIAPVPVPVPAKKVELGLTDELLEPYEDEPELLLESPPVPGSSDGVIFSGAFLANSANVVMVRDLFLAGLQESQ